MRKWRFSAPKHAVWLTSSGIISLALGIKMNILLFLPGLLVLLFQYKGAIGTIVSVGMIAIIQASPFSRGQNIFSDTAR